MRYKSELKEIAALFLKLGFTAFGGPAAHIAMMQHEVVKKREWLTDQQFLDLLGATNLIPGPNSTEMAIHIGQEKGGWRGLLLAGSCFILPAVFITVSLAWAYKKYGQLPQVQPFIYGIAPAIIGIILSAAYALAKKSAKTSTLTILGASAFFLSLINITEIYVLFGTGLAALLIRTIKQQSSSNKKNFLFPFSLLQISTATFATTLNAKLFFTFLKIGSILYGSGYVLFAFLNTELVATGILQPQQLVDAIAIGQFTPGPVFSAVTFIGYLLNGFSGAAVSTAGIFLPSFLFVAALNPLVKKVRGSTRLSAFLDGVNIAAVGIIAAVCIEMGKSAITDWRTLLIAFLSIIITFRYTKINSALIVLGGSLAGALLTLIRLC